MANNLGSMILIIDKQKTLDGLDNKDRNFYILKNIYQKKAEG